MAEKPKNDGTVDGEMYELAGLIERLVAHLMDQAIIGFLFFIVLFFIPQRPVIYLVGLLVPIVYHWWFWTRKDGQTPGKWAMGVRVIKSDGTEIRDIDALLRAIGYQASGILFGLGYLWAFIDKDNQTFHDKIARTYVVRNDEKRKVVVV